MPRNRTRIRYCGRVRKNRFGLADAVFRLLLPRCRSALSAPDTSLLTSVFQTQRRILRRRTPSSRITDVMEKRRLAPCQSRPTHGNSRPELTELLLGRTKAYTVDF